MSKVIFDPLVGGLTLHPDPPPPQYVEAGGGLNFVHTQGTPASTWTVVHNLGRIPHVTVLGVDGEELLPDVIHGSINVTTIVHGSPHAGSAHFVA